MAVPLAVTPAGLEITVPGAYALTGSVVFDGVGAPAGLLDPITGAPRWGLLISADDVDLDLSGFSLALSTPLAAWRLREFGCVGVSGRNVRVRNGTLGRSSLCCVEWLASATGVLEDVTLRDFELGAALLAGTARRVTVGAAYAGPRLSAEHSLAARYLPTLEAAGAGGPLALELQAAVASGPRWSDAGTGFGVAVLVGGLAAGLDAQPATRAPAAVEDVTVAPLRLRAALPPFLALSADQLPSGALGDPIPAAGASELRARAQATAATLGLLPPPDPLPPCPPSLGRACSTTATNFGVCTSCTRERVVAPPRAKLFYGLDALGRKQLGLHGVWLRAGAPYSLENLVVGGLRAEGVVGSPGACVAERVFATQTRVLSSELTLVGCLDGTAEEPVPEPTLLNTPRPAGAPCVLPQGFSAAWVPYARGPTLVEVERPVGNPQNVQLTPTVLPPNLPCGRF